MCKVTLRLMGMLFFGTALLLSSLYAIAQSPTECDRLAAHPEDPAKLSDGVVDEALNSDQAIIACKSALGQNAQSGRLWFQLGRAHWVADNDESAVEAFSKSALEFDYAPAQAHLALAYEFGYVTGEVDENAARILYEMSANAGFEPAVSRLDGLPLPRPLDVGGEDRRAFRFSAYKQPKILKALYVRDFPHLNKNALTTLAYLRGMHEFFSQSTIWQNMSCAYIQDTRMTQKVIRAITGMSPNSAVQNSATMFNRLKEHFMKRMSQGTDGALETLFDLMEMGSLTKDGKLDSAKLAESQADQQCDSEEMKILYKNAQFYVLKQMTFTR